ncbi:MAG: hypothetical protein Q4D43_11300 [Clostridia bacterium]|nr:hypothetical protein [Clostridia bacterium]
MEKIAVCHGDGKCAVGNQNVPQQKSAACQFALDGGFAFALRKPLTIQSDDLCRSAEFQSRKVTRHLFLQDESFTRIIT